MVGRRRKGRLEVSELRRETSELRANLYRSHGRRFGNGGEEVNAVFDADLIPCLR